MKIFNTAAEVFEDAQIEQGNAIAALARDPTSNAARDRLASSIRALCEAARFAEKNKPTEKTP